MAKSKYETHVACRFDDIKKWLKEGAIEKEIAARLDIGHATFQHYKRTHTELHDLVIAARKQPVQDIKAAMYRKAVGFKYEEVKVTERKIAFDDWTREQLETAGINPDELERPTLIKTETTIKQSLPDSTAGLILLKHWDKDQEWTSDPASLKLKKKELKLKEEEHW